MRAPDTAAARPSLELVNDAEHRVLARPDLLQSSRLVALAHKVGAITLVLIVLLLGDSAQAAETSGANPYKLAPGDRINVLVMGQVELSGTFTVDNAGEIRLPLMGTLAVGGRTALECQDFIRQGLSEGFLKQPVVFVRVAEVRPIVVLGDVKNSGSYEYRYGSIVKTAIAQAGGLGMTSPSASLSMDYLVADERVHLLSANRDRLHIRRARLEAQLAGAATFAAPKPLTISEAEAQCITAEEQKMLDMALNASSVQIKLLQSQRPFMMAEDEAIKNQIAAENQQVALLSEQINTFAVLNSKGLAKSSSMLELNLAVNVKQSNVFRLEAERSKLRLVINDLDARLHQVEQSSKDQILLDLRGVQQQLFEVETTLPSARELRAARLQAAGRSIDGKPLHSITITRANAGTVATMDATEMTALEPGDIVELKRQDLDAPATRLGIGSAPRAMQ